MTRWEKIDAAFDYFRSQRVSDGSFTLDDVSRATGWSRSTVQTHVSKKLFTVCDRLPHGRLRVLPSFDSLSREAFRGLLSQKAGRRGSISGVLVDKAVAACVSAIEVYNKPSFLFRAENFAALMTNAWELLLKARIVRDAGEDLEAIYARSRKKDVLLTRSGNKRTISAMAAADSLHADGRLSSALRGNLRALFVLRDEVVHYVATDPALDRRVHEVGSAAVRNFATAAMEWFGFDFSGFNWFLMPISLKGSPTTDLALPLRTEARRLLTYLDEVLLETPDDDPLFAAALRVDVQYVKTDADGAMHFRPTTNPDAPEMRMREDDRLDQYPYTYQKLASVLRSRYEDFKQNHDFHQQLERLRSRGEEIFMERRLDPRNPASSAQKFYHTRTVEEFDRCYVKKRKS